MPKCPHCPAKYSTQEEVDRHYEAKWEHLRERLAASEIAHLETKVSASQAWGEHLLDCKEQNGYERGVAAVIAKLRSWAAAVEKGHAMCPAGGDVDVIHTLRKSADAIEKGEDHPAWAR